jgi:hypothetical protein
MQYVTKGEIINNMSIVQVLKKIVKIFSNSKFFFPQHMKTQSKGFLYWGCNINDNKLWIFLSYIWGEGGGGGWGGVESISKQLPSLC